MERRAVCHSQLTCSRLRSEPRLAALLWHPERRKLHPQWVTLSKLVVDVQQCHQPPQLQFEILGRVGQKPRQHECLLVSDDIPVENVLRLDEDERPVPGLPGASNQKHALLDRHVGKLSDGLGEYGGR